MNAPSPPARRATGLSLAVILLVVTAVVSVIVLHVARPDVSPLTQMMSEYANGPLGFLMSLVFYAVGVSGIALAVRSGRALQRGRVVTVFRALLGLGGTGLILAGVYEVGGPLDPETVEEAVHSGASVAAFVLLVGAMVLFSLLSRANPAWRTFWPFSAALTTAAVVLAVLSPLGDKSPWGGVAQRALGLVVLLWLLLTALRIRSNAFRRRAPRGSDAGTADVPVG